jgi:hypothetical protein
MNQQHKLQWPHHVALQKNCQIARNQNKEMTNILKNP